MPNYVIYQAISTDEVYECSYSLLKYLDVYNLKPPADHSVVIYTGKPALLEAYGSFFNSFELRETKPEHFSKSTGTATTGIIRQAQILSEFNGNILYLPTNAYPVKELENLFAAINRGAIYSGKTSTTIQGERANPAFAIGFNSQQHSAHTLTQSSTQAIGDFIEQYQDLKEFRKLLRDFFRRYQEESIPNQVKLMHSIDACAIQDQKNKFKKLPLLKRMLRTMMGKGWDIGKYGSRV
jgi:hypothetical protein